MNFAKQIAIVTGGGSGIGYECASQLLKAGVQKVCISDIYPEMGHDSLERLKKQYGAESAIYLQADTTKNSDIEALFKQVKKKWNGFDIVINNAGLLDDKHWARMVACNINGVVKGTFLAFDYMAKHNGGKGGTVINLSSILGLSVMGSSPVYVGSKHFVMGFSRSLGMPFHYNRSGVRVMIMCPGVTITHMVTDAHFYSTTKETATEIRRELDSLTPQGVDIVGKGIIKMLTEGESGSVWVSEGGENYEVVIPDFRTKLRKASPK